MDAAELPGIGTGDNIGGNGDVGLSGHVVVQHLLHVHLVDMVGRENADMVGIIESNQVKVLENSVTRPLVPVLTSPHLGRGQGHEVIPVPQGSTELPTPFYMLVQGLALELDEDIDRKETTVHQVGERKIDDPVLGSKGDSRFGPILGEWHQPLPFAPGENNGKNPAVLPVYHV